MNPFALDPATLKRYDRLAASHWKKAVALMRSNVDLHDIRSFFPDCGLSGEQADELFRTLDKIARHCDAVLEPKES